MTLAEWGNPTALFSYRLKRLSTVEIRAGCRLWVRAQAEPTPGKGKGHSPRRGRQESGSSAEKTYKRTRVRSISGRIIGTLECSSPWGFDSAPVSAGPPPGANCSASVEPASAVVEEFPLAITCVTISK